MLDSPALPPRARPLPVPAVLAALGAGVVALGASLVALRFLATRPGLLPMAVLAGLAGVLLVARPAWIVPGFVALTWMAIGQSFFGGFSPVEAGSLALLALALWHAPEHPGLARDALLLSALIGLPIAIAWLLSPDGMPFPRGEITDLAFIPLVALNLRGADAGRRLAIALAATGLFLGAGAVWSIAVGPSDLFPVSQPDGTQAARAAGPFGEPNFFALSLAALLPFACWLIGHRGAFRPLGLASAVAIAGGILATGSRGALIAGGFGLVAFAIASPNRRVRAGAIAIVLSGLVLTPLFGAQTESSSARGLAGRATENLIAVQMFADHPLVGVGPNGYPPRYRDYAREHGNDPRVLRAPHSLPLEIAAEQGIAGIVGWLGAALLLFALARRWLWQTLIGRATTISIGIYMIGSLFLHGSQLRIVYMLAGAALALAALTARHGEEALA